MKLTVVVLAALGWTVVAAAQTPAADPIAAGYARLYEGDSAGAWKHFQSLHAANPTSLAPWFGLLVTTDMRSELDEALKTSFEPDIAAFLDLAEQRYDRSHGDAEALFYLTQGYLLRSKYRIDNDRGVLGAARDAARAKGYGDAYVKQHPEHGDAYLAVGLYNYYVDIAPTFVKMLRVLLFLPSGSRAQGLSQLERAAKEGSLFAPLADVVIADIYGSIEGRLKDALALNEQLVQRFPNNAALRFDLADRYMNPIVEAYDRAADQFTAVMNRANGSSPDDLQWRHRAIIGMALLRRNQWRLEDAIALLTPVIDQNVQKPAWVMPSYLVRRANYRALLNDPGAAEDARRVLGNPKAEYRKAAERQLTFIEGRRKTDESTVYADLIAGNRLVVEHRWSEAATVYDRVDAAHPNNWQVKYRRAYLEFARGNYGAARRGFGEIASARAPMPSWLKAQALLNLGWTQDLAGERSEAVRTYKRVVDDYEDEAAAGPARVGLLSPYRRS